MAPRTWWWAVAGAVVLAACGDDDDPGGAGRPDGGSATGGSGSIVSGPRGSGGSSGIQAALRDYYDAWCDLYDRCGSGLYLDHATCVERSLCGAEGLLEASGATEREISDCAALADQIRDCSLDVVPDDSPCMALTSRLVATFDSGGCAGRVCGPREFCDDSVPGCETCRRRIALGGTCSGAGCSLDAYCDESGVCAARVGEGEPCRRLEQCATIGFSPGRLRCIDGVCTTAGDAGDACDNQFSCGFGLFCDGTRCMAQLPDGSSCTTGGECLYNSYCLNGTCTRVCGLRSQTEGSICAFDLQCREGYCDRETTACAAPLSDGAACTNSSQCGLESFCDETDSCAPKHALGEDCRVQGACREGACVDGSCQQPMCG